MRECQLKYRGPFLNNDESLSIISTDILKSLDKCEENDLQYSKKVRRMFPHSMAVVSVGQ